MIMSAVEGVDTLQSTPEFTNEEAAVGSRLRPILRTFNGSSTDIEASAVISGDGLALAWVLDESVDQDRFGAMCASLLALAERASQEIARGTLKQVLVEGDKGTMLLVHAGDDAVLAVATRPTINLGMVFIEARKTAGKIEVALMEI
jgi:predicted regulator of Ras-like GTPase activity (Roadblock/LC7/MglB family)